MTRPIKRKSKFKIKVQRRDIARAEQKKLMAEWRKHFESGKMPTIGETFFSTTISRSVSVRSHANIDNFAGSMRTRRRLVVRAKMHSAIGIDKTWPHMEFTRPTGNRRTKYSTALKHRLKGQLALMEVMDKEIKGRAQAKRDMLAANQLPTTEQLDDLQRTTTNFPFTAITDPEVKERFNNAPSYTELLESARERHLELPRAFGDVDSKLFSAPIQRGYAEGIKTVADNMAKQQEGSQEDGDRFRTRRKVLEYMASGMSATEALQKALSETAPEVREVLSRYFSGAEGKITAIEEPKEGDVPQYGVNLNFLMTEMPQPQEDEIIINQRQADSLEKVKEVSGAKRPLPITRGHYGDLMAAAQYPGMKKIADELFKNGVEFIEPSDPRAMLADYSICFMYPNVIEAYDLSKTKFNAELPEQVSESTSLHNPDSISELQETAKNESPYPSTIEGLNLSKGTIVKNVQKWMDGDDKKENEK